MLELLATVDPMAALMGGLWLFAAGMFPVGFMLGSSCSPCCSSATLCGIAEADLPETVSVQFGQWSDRAAAPGPDLIRLLFTSNFGSGAAGRVTAPGVTPGPISGVQVTSGGSGYARLGRIAPVITATVAGNGSGASLTPILQIISDDFWEVNGLPVWQVAGASVDAQGTGYDDFAAVTFAAEPGTPMFSSATGYIRTAREKPVLSAVVQSQTGSFADLRIDAQDIVQITTWDGSVSWSVAAINIDAAGTGYEVGDLVDVGFAGTPTPGRIAEELAYGVVGSVGPSGGITSINVLFGGSYYIQTGRIASVVVPEQTRGAWYKESVDAPPHVAQIEIEILQFSAPGDATGGELAAVVDIDPTSATFGTVTGLTIVNPGTGYLAYALNVQGTCCGWYWSGISLVLKQDTQNKCVYRHAIAGNNCGAVITLTYNSAGSSLSVDATGCSTILVADNDEGPVLFPFVAEDQYGYTANISAGGVYIPGALAENETGNGGPCCRGLGPAPAEIMARVTPPADSIYLEAFKIIFDLDEDATDFDVALTRDVNGFFGSDCHPAWGLTVIGISFNVSIRRCGQYTGFLLGVGEVPIGENQCPPRCETMVSITLANYLQFPNVWYFAEEFKECLGGNMCRPRAGVYEITRRDPRHFENVKKAGTSNANAVRGYSVPESEQWRLEIL